MKWLRIKDSLVEIESYRLFVLRGQTILGTYVMEDDAEIICSYSSEEQAEEAFTEFCMALSPEEAIKEA
jgi:hypothetical protein